MVHHYFKDSPYKFAFNAPLQFHSNIFMLTNFPTGTSTGLGIIVVASIMLHHIVLRRFVEAIQSSFHTVKYFRIPGISSWHVTRRSHLLTGVRIWNSFKIGKFPICKATTPLKSMTFLSYTIHSNSSK